MRRSQDKILGMYKRAPIHGQTKGFRALCVPLKGILNICTKCSEWDIKFSHYNERAGNKEGAAEVSTNSEKYLGVHLVNTGQNTLKMALYQSAQLIYLTPGSQP